MKFLYQNKTKKSRGNMRTEGKKKKNEVDICLRRQEKQKFVN